MKLVTSYRGRCTEVGDEPMAFSFPSAPTGTPRQARGRRIVKVSGLRLAMQLAIAIVVFSAAAGGAATKAFAFSRHELEANMAYLAKTATAHRGKAIAVTIPSRGSADSKPNTSKISCGPLPMVGG